jgi:hypothetical protein
MTFWQGFQEAMNILPALIDPGLFGFLLGLVLIVTAIFALLWLMRHIARIVNL